MKPYRNPYDPLNGNSRWLSYNEMMDKRDPVEPDNPDTCAKCHRRWGNHLTEYALKNNPYACRFVEKSSTKRNSP